MQELTEFQRLARASATIIVETIGPKNWGAFPDDKMVSRIRRKLEQLCPEYEDRLRVGGVVCGFMDLMMEKRQR